MVVWIAAIFTVVLAAVWMRSKKKFEGIDGADVAGVSVASLFFGTMLFVVAALVASATYGTGEDQDWDLVSEDTYIIAEDAKVAVNNYTLEFIEDADGDLRHHTKDFDRIDYIFDGADTVVVQEYHAELGNLIFPWGLGQDRTHVIIK